MKNITNKMRIEIEAKSENESVARTCVAAFATQLDPTIDEVNDLKTAVSEAVTNSIVHAGTKTVVLECALFDDRSISVKVIDFGSGIVDIQKALEPFFTTKPDQERSGMGFTVMQSFMDSLKVTNGKSGGTIVQMTKSFNECAGA